MINIITAIAPTIKSNTLLTLENTPDSPNSVAGWSAPRAELAPSTIDPIAAAGSGESSIATTLTDASIPNNNVTMLHDNFPEVSF